MLFLVQWMVLVVPLLLSMTIYAEAPGALSVLLLVPSAILLLLPPIENGSPLPSKANECRLETATPIHDRDIRHDQPEGTGKGTEVGGEDQRPHQGYRVSPIQRLPALTSYRGHMMLLTVLSIFAVDFRVFPRTLAKCETYGVSLMDLGVGSFVFSQGVVSAVPLLKDPSYLHKPLFSRLVQTLKKVAPLAGLGLIRLIALKGTDYPEHVTEYGVHWNFFLTLALVNILEVFIHRLIAYIPPVPLGLWIGVLQQSLLSFAGFKDFLLSSPRTNVISANKEGLVSLLGYLSIHILGLAVGMIILPPKPSYLRKQPFSADGRKYTHSARSDLGAPRQTAKIIAELFSYSIVWWILLAFVRIKLDVSRRMVNLSYILWTTATNTSVILGYHILDAFFFPSRVLRLKNSSDPTGKRLLLEDSATKSNAPPLLEAVNKNSLVIFLLANIVTGLTNLSVETLYIPNGQAILILGGYAFGICTFVWLFRDVHLWKL